MRRGRIGERRQHRLGIVRRRAASPPPAAPPAPRRSRRACLVTHTPDAFTHERPELFGNRRGHHVDVLLPLVGDVRSDHDLAVARSVHFDARIALSSAWSSRHRRTPCRGRTTAESRCRPRDRSGSSRTPRRARRPESGLDDAVRRPRLGAARLQHQRHLQHDGRHPQGMHAGRIARQHHAQRVGAREEAEQWPSPGLCRRRAPTDPGRASGRRALLRRGSARRAIFCMLRRTHRPRHARSWPTPARRSPAASA